MKKTYTTASTTFTVNRNNNEFDPKKQQKAFEKEIDQTLFSKPISVKDLPWVLVSSDPKGLIKFNIDNTISRLVKTLEKAEKLEHNGKKATFDIDTLAEAKSCLERVMLLAILYKRYHRKPYADISNPKLIDKVHSELLRFIDNYHL